MKTEERRINRRLTHETGYFNRGYDLNVILTMFVVKYGNEIKNFLSIFIIYFIC